MTVLYSVATTATNSMFAKMCDCEDTRSPVRVSSANKHIPNNSDAGLCDTQWDVSGI